MDQNKLVNRIKKIVLGTMLGVCLLLGNTAALHASSFSIWASSAVVSPNEAFAVTIVTADCTGRVNISVSNGTASGKLCLGGKQQRKDQRLCRLQRHGDGNRRSADRLFRCRRQYV